MKGIGDFAASLIEEDIQQIKTGKALPPRRDKNSPKVEANQRDISEVEVPEDFRKAVLFGESYNPNPWPSQELEQYEEPEVEPTNALTGEPLPSAGLLTESQGNEIIDLLLEVKGLIKEMTGTFSGMGGVNFAGPEATKPKSKRKKSRKDVLKESLRSKVRRHS
jgi:hypothetical protein